MKSRTPTPFPARPTTTTEAQAIGAFAAGVVPAAPAVTPPVLPRPSYNAGLSRTHHKRGMPSRGGMR